MGAAKKAGLRPAGCRERQTPVGAPAEWPKQLRLSRVSRGCRNDVNQRRSGVSWAMMPL
jgi:hypothetical protein